MAAALPDEVFKSMTNACIVKIKRYRRQRGPGTSATSRHMHSTDNDW